MLDGVENRTILSRLFPEFCSARVNFFLHRTEGVPQTHREIGDDGIEEFHFVSAFHRAAEIPVPGCEFHNLGAEIGKPLREPLGDHNGKHRRGAEEKQVHDRERLLVDRASRYFGCGEGGENAGTDGEVQRQKHHSLEEGCFENGRPKSFFCFSH